MKILNKIIQEGLFDLTTKIKPNNLYLKEDGFNDIGQYVGDLFTMVSESNNLFRKGNTKIKMVNNKTNEENIIETEEFKKSFVKMEHFLFDDKLHMKQYLKKGTIEDKLKDFNEITKRIAKNETITVPYGNLGRKNIGSGYKEVEFVDDWVCSVVRDDALYPIEEPFLKLHLMGITVKIWDLNNMLVEIPKLKY